ncbi:MAG: winged helix-turn-helix domain-containing protein [Armatimonadetes bacterium]|nr:winged helix-turn-helix domain-containing protein [Armatimonadota bacterium]
MVWLVVMLMGQAEALRPSSQSELEKQLDRSGQELLRGPRAHGYATDLWTCPRVGAVIRRLFGIEYSDCHVWKLLRKMGWTRQPQGHFVIVHGDVVISRMAARGR